MQPPPRQPKYHVLKEYANGVVDAKGKFFPYVTKEVNITTTTSTPAAHTRYYVKRVIIFCRVSAAEATTYVNAYSYVQGVATVLASMTTIPSTAATYNYEFFPGTLCDVGAAITWINGVAAPIEGKAYLLVAEVYENSGEYNG